MAIQLDAAIRHAEALVSGGGRILGIVGKPGSGKSTLTAALLDHFGDAAAPFPMDGFHLSNDELARRGLADRKGAPETFDADGYVAMLQRVCDRRHDVLAPVFVRSMDESIAAAIRIGVDQPLVITEGNYLLLRIDPWSKIATLLDESWFVQVDDRLRYQRLIDRHVGHGRSPQAATEWVDRSDEANATLIDRFSAPADLQVSLDGLSQ